MVGLAQPGNGGPIATDHPVDQCVSLLYPVQQDVFTVLHTDARGFTTQQPRRRQRRIANSIRREFPARLRAQRTDQMNYFEFVHAGAAMACFHCSLIPGLRNWQGDSRVPECMDTGDFDLRIDIA